MKGCSIDIMEKRNLTRTKIIQYLFHHPATSKSELARDLDLSMPTVLSHIGELLQDGMIAEIGEYASTGGRKAKSIGLNPSYCQSMGLVITANHLEMVLVNLKFEIQSSRRTRLKFSRNLSYCAEVSSQVRQFLADCSGDIPVLGIGVAIPGIIDPQKQLVTKSHALDLNNYSLQFLSQALPLPAYFENDANAAMLAEDPQKYQNAVYLSLNHTLGGAFCMDGKLFRGQSQKAGEFGHMILIPGGKTCYCGKSGCADAYCAASALTDGGRISLEEFLTHLLSKEPDFLCLWERYLDHLAVLVSNLRMAYDMDIILGGDVGGIFAEYPEQLMALSEKLMLNNRFDQDTSYLRICSYKKEASAIGAAKHFFAEIC